MRVRKVTAAGRRRGCGLLCTLCSTYNGGTDLQHEMPNQKSFFAAPVEDAITEANRGFEVFGAIFFSNRLERVQSTMDCFQGN